MTRQSQDESYEHTSLLDLDFARVFANSPGRNQKDVLALWLWKDDLRKRIEFEGYSDLELEVQWRHTTKSDQERRRWTTLSNGILHFGCTVLGQIRGLSVQEPAAERLQALQELAVRLNLPQELCFLNERSIAVLRKENGAKTRKMKSFAECWKRIPHQSKKHWIKKAMEFVMAVAQSNRAPAAKAKTECPQVQVPCGAVAIAVAVTNLPKDSPTCSSNKSNHLYELDLVCAEKPASLLGINLRNAFSAVGTDQGGVDRLAFFLWKDDVQKRILHQNQFTDQQLEFYWRTELQKGAPRTARWIELSKGLLNLHRMLQKEWQLGKTESSEFQKPAYKLCRLNEWSLAQLDPTRLKSQKEMDETWQKLSINAKRLWEAKIEEFRTPSIVQKEISASPKAIEIVERAADAPIPEPVRFTRTLADNISESPFVPSQHPYNDAIIAWTPNQHACAVNPILPKSMKDTPLLLVDNQDKLASFMLHISSAAVSEIAIDVEHHSEHSFLGHTCIIQVSTRTHDFILDWLRLGRKLECLNSVTTNPQVVKVLHGSESDILWLQRDCGVYIVGLFDTFVAAKAVGLKEHGLGHLLEKYCHVGISKEEKKRYQRADWRLRPLPTDMVAYARQDTHYLLYIYDCMKNQLLHSPRGLDDLLDIYKNSSRICLQNYKKPECNPEELLALPQYSRYNHNQRTALTGLAKLRDSVARELDESLGMIMSNKTLGELAQLLPEKKADVVKHWWNRLEGDYHAKHLDEIHKIILHARSVRAEHAPLPEKAKAGKSGSIWKNISQTVRKAFRWAAGSESKNKNHGNLPGKSTKPPEEVGEDSDESLDVGVDCLAAGVDAIKIAPPPQPLLRQLEPQIQIRPPAAAAAREFDSSKTPYRSLPVIPSIAELLSPTDNLLPPTRQPGTPFLNAVDYVDTQFRLLREDFLLCLKEGVQSFLSSESKQNPTKVVIHDNIKICKKTFNKRKGTTNWTFLLPKKLGLSLRDSSGRFLPGHLLLFTADQGRTFYFALITYQKANEDYSVVTFSVEFCNRSEPNWGEGTRFDTLECGAYFEPYRRVMDALQGKNFASFPLTKYLVAPNQAKIPPLPGYLRRVDRNYKLGNFLVNPSAPASWPGEAMKFGLNSSQYEALKAALTWELAVVQGPPGTGKTYLGVQIVKILMENRSLWKAGGGGPIIVMCLTNHALDQFLEQILDLYTPEEAEEGFVVRNPKIIRLGGGGDSERVADYKWNKEISKANADIVFLTTTGAARRFKELTVLRSRIMIVEEAAEVFEAHIAAAFTQHLEQLILLGDHQQLRPICATASMSDHNLDMSLFERLVRANFRRCILTQQRRMRPAIRDLITGTIYKTLTDDPFVLNYPERVSGMEQNLFFLDHQEPEAKKPGSTSTYNQHEAEMVVQLAEYLICHGNKALKIVVLATYMSQVQVIKSLMERHPLCKEVAVETADSYQGEENDIVLLSLVRSNDAGQIGFMRTDNRICVALSRARYGLYIFGNMALLSRASPTWRKIKAKLEAGSNIGPEIKLNVCGKHGVTAQAKEPVEFQELMWAGCAKCLATAAKIRKRRFP